MQSKQTLTPTLSLSERERVNHSAPLAQSLNGDSVERDQKRPPLLGGEGRGEGESMLFLNGYGEEASVLLLQSARLSPN